MQLTPSVEFRSEAWTIQIEMEKLNILLFVLLVSIKHMQAELNPYEEVGKGITTINTILQISGALDETTTAQIIDIGKNLQTIKTQLPRIMEPRLGNVSDATNVAVSILNSTIGSLESSNRNTLAIAFKITLSARVVTAISMHSSMTLNDISLSLVLLNSAMELLFTAERTTFDYSLIKAAKDLIARAHRIVGKNNDEHHIVHIVVALTAIFIDNELSDANIWINSTPSFIGAVLHVHVSLVRALHSHIDGAITAIKLAAKFMHEVSYLLKLHFDAPNHIKQFEFAKRLLAAVQNMIEKVGAGYIIAPNAIADIMRTIQNMLNNQGANSGSFSFIPKVRLFGDRLVSVVGNLLDSRINAIKFIIDLLNITNDILDDEEIAAFGVTKIDTASKIVAAADEVADLAQLQSQVPELKYLSSSLLEKSKYPNVNDIPEVRDDISKLVKKLHKVRW